MKIDELITYIIIIFALAVIIKLFSWLLPILVILAIAYVLYIFIKEGEY
jgi:predicted membrane protein